MTVTAVKEELQVQKEFFINYFQSTDGHLQTRGIVLLTRPDNTYSDSYNQPASQHLYKDHSLIISREVLILTLSIYNALNVGIS